MRGKTPGSCLPQASWWVSPRWSPARCRWRPASTHPSVPKPNTERADLALERTELATDRAGEEQELAAIYVRRGLELALARTVAQQLMSHDALGAHAREELGLHDKLAARPLQAALASAATFAVGAALPILTVMLAPQARLVLAVSGASLMCLAALGALAARAGGASAWIGAGRVTFWGALAMAATAGVGALFGTKVS